MTNSNHFRKSKDNFSFSKITYETRLNENPADDAARDMLQWYENLLADDDKKQYNDEFRQTLEYELRTSDALCEKVKTPSYAQNLYAALCNNDFTKNGVTSFYSWRAAGRIVANMREQGDYIDWYCSGIIPDDALEEAPKSMDNYVCEGTVTDEVLEDLKSLGWNLN